MIAILATLEQKVLQELRNAVEESKIKSKHTGQKTLPVNVFDYTELTIINGRLTFLDKDGLHYTTFTVSLEDLIDIINDLKN